MAIVLLVSIKNGQTFELPILGKFSLGRSRSCDLPVDDDQMSGQHGLFELNSKGVLTYTDLESTNGSFLNESKIQKIHFKINETLRLGNTTITIDQKKLNAQEKITLGAGIDSSSKKSIDIQAQEEQKPKNQPKIKIGVKKDNPHERKDNLFEQEASTGKTQFLKLDIDSKKKK